MRDQNGNPISMPLDPMMYIGRLHRDEETGRVKIIEVFYDTDVVHLEQDDEFITFTTIILLEEKN